MQSDGKRRAFIASPRKLVLQQKKTAMGIAETYPQSRFAPYVGSVVLTIIATSFWFRLTVGESWRQVAKKSIALLNDR
tara:strand:- start:40 stop:273 length:234 start_codon:yes stop_codon:yes gene_type:complete